MVPKGTEGAVKETEKGASYKGMSTFVIILHNHDNITSIEQSGILSYYCCAPFKHFRTSIVFMSGHIDRHKCRIATTQFVVNDGNCYYYYYYNYS